MKTIVATLCYVRSGERTLMMHRNKKDGDVHRGKWNGLGGKLDSGESPDECVVREIREESGLTLVKTLPRLASWAFLRPSMAINLPMNPTLCAVAKP